MASIKHKCSSYSFSVSLEGCSMATMGKCYKYLPLDESVPDDLIEVSMPPLLHLTEMQCY